MGKARRRERSCINMSETIISQISKAAKAVVRAEEERDSAIFGYAEDYISACMRYRTAVMALAKLKKRREEGGGSTPAPCSTIELTKESSP
jgi:hypothetical protein